MVFSQCNDYIEGCLDEGGKARKTQSCFHGLNMSCNPDKDCLFTCIIFFLLQDKSQEEDSHGSLPQCTHLKCAVVSGGM